VFPIRDNVPTRSLAVVTIGLIAANAVVWFWQIGGTPLEEDIAYGYYPCTLEGPCEYPPGVPPAELDWYSSAFTSMFMHGSWLHIAGNMLFLWIFGNNVEDSLGRVRYLVWYLAGGLAATAAQTVVTLSSGDAADASIPNIGASGAVSAVLGAYFLLLPGARVLTVIFVVIIFVREIPAVFFLGIWILLQAYEGGIELLSPESGGGVALFAHIGGFVFGMLTIHLVKLRSPLRPSY
jgi:membrane associated rhomboid family serine protease